MLTYNFDFKVGIGDTLERINLSARYHGVRYWTRPERLSFWHPSLLKLDLFIFSYWAVMRNTITFHIDYWFDKALKRRDEITIELRQLGRFNQLRKTEITKWVPIADYLERKSYWDAKLIAFGERKPEKRKIEVIPISKPNHIPLVKNQVERQIVEPQYRPRSSHFVTSSRSFFLFLMMLQSGIHWQSSYKDSWFKYICYNHPDLFFAE